MHFAFHVIYILLTHTCLHFLDMPHKIANMNLERPILHQYYTRSKVRAMAEDPATCVERLEKAHLELQEKYTKSCDDISQMMKMLKMLTREKQSVETPNPKTETTPLRGTNEHTPYMQGFTLPRETPTTYASPSVAFPFNYGPPHVVKTPRLVLHEPKTNVDLVDPLAVPNFDELAEKKEITLG